MTTRGDLFCCALKENQLQLRAILRPLLRCRLRRRNKEPIDVAVAHEVVLCSSVVLANLLTIRARRDSFSIHASLMYFTALELRLMHART